MFRHYFAFIVALTLIHSAGASVIRVPSQYPTIQAGINAASSGDTVLVAEGTYTGGGNKNIDFLGKAITVTSQNGPDSTIIDCEDDGRGFYFHSNEDTNSVLSGFTITNGNTGNGGGISCESSSPGISNCVFSGNFAGGGGGVFCDNSSPIFENCIIRENSADYRGGGIFLHDCDTNPTFSQCIITGNSTPGYSYGGGGICGYGGSATISNCIISENFTDDEGGGGICIEGNCQMTISFCVISSNTAAQYGGGIYCFKSNSIIENCIIEGNTAFNGGGIFCNSWQAPSPTIINCTVSRNSADNSGGGIFYVDAEADILNTIVEGNVNGGIHLSGVQGEITYGDFFNNEGGNFTGNVPPGLGEIVTVNANGDSCDVFYNIFEDPLFEDPMSGNFQITWANFPIPDSTKSPCIDAGDPASPLDPDSTIADIGAFFFDQRTLSPLTVTVQPHSTPIIVPSGGGTFSYTVTVRNISTTRVGFHAWTETILPNGSVYGPLFSRANLMISAGAVLSRQLSQYVPVYAPPGDYSYVTAVFVVPDSVIASDNFPFTKLTGADHPQHSKGWKCTGWDEIDSPFMQPEEFISISAHPNPFNLQTDIRFQMPAASQIKLAVYDITGREVLSLMEGFTTAGEYDVRFNGANLVSGIYFLRAQVKGVSKTVKLLLVK